MTTEQPGQNPPPPAAPPSPTPPVAPNDSFMVQRMGTEEGPYSFLDLQMQVRAAP